MKVRVERACFVDGVLHAAGEVVTVDDRLKLAHWMTPLGRGRASRPSGNASGSLAPSSEPSPAAAPPAA